MSKIADVALALCVLYPHKHELSKARLTKLVYLCDWKSAKEYGRQITPITWKFHQYGPYVDDVFNEVSADGRFSIVVTENFYGQEKTVINDNVERPVRVGLNKKEIEIVREVIRETKNLYWDAFIKHVYSTPPVARSARFDELDLIKTAAQ